MHTFSRPFQRPTVARKQSHSSYSQALELLSNLSCAKTEDEAIRAIIHVFDDVFQPQDIVYIAMQSDIILSVRPNQTPPEVTQTLVQQAKKIDPDTHDIDRTTSPIFPIVNHGETFGIISLTFGEMMIPDQHFYDVGRLLALHTGVVISNLRARLKLKDDDRLLQKTSSIDGLTGLSSPNRFFDIAELEFRRSKRYRRPLSALMVEIDDFQSIIEKYGSEIGGHILVELSRIFNKELRESDIRVRMGGEVLLILLPETTIRYAQSLAERLRRRITGMPIEVSGTPVFISINLGVVSLESSIKSLEEFINGCDMALAQAKRQGPNQVGVWAPPVKEYNPVYNLPESDFRIGFY